MEGTRSEEDKPRDLYNREKIRLTLRENKLRREAQRKLQDEVLKECSFQPNASARSSSGRTRTARAAAELESPDFDSSSRFNQYMYGGSGFIVVGNKDKELSSTMLRSNEWRKRQSFSSVRVPWDTGDATTTHGQTNGHNLGGTHRSQTHERLYRQKTCTASKRESITRKQREHQYKDEDFETPQPLEESENGKPKLSDSGRSGSSSLRRSPTHERLYQQKTFSAQKREDILRKQRERRRKALEDSKSESKENLCTVDLTQEELSSLIRSVVQNLTGSEIKLP
eukprot:gb/GECG01012051.1/.p1 GENE.gb/GECG01012051.1/~~gb/GECG01012051.1/.p1  ORF type:complete len:283 (+),score=37.09 gb/GECG01012051.1/:1-849(+)